MATNDNKAPKDGSRSLKAHNEPEKLAAHPEPARLEAYKEDEEIVPAVTADVDETPKFIKYGAAVLLGLAFGLGCYIWYDGGFPSQPQNPEGPFASRAANYDYFNSNNDYEIYYSDADIPSPFEATAYDLEPQVVTAEVASVPDADGAMATAGDIPVVVYLFQYDSSKIPETAALTNIANRASKAGMALDVKAYTDEHGRVAYNKRLSERRAKAIADYLVAHGMPAAKVVIHPMGPTHQFGSDAADRRAEITPLRQ